AGTLPGGWNDGINGNSLAYAEPLVVAKEKRLVLFDRTPKTPPELVLAELRFRQLRSSQVVVPVRIQGVVPQEFERRAMKRVGSRFREDVDDSGGGAADVRAIQVRLNFEFLDRVNRRPHTDRADKSLIIVHAVDEVVIRHRILAIDGVG